MKKRNKFLFMGIIALLIVMFILFFKIREEEKLPVTFYLSDKPGFDFTPGYLSFGKIIVNQSATRSVQIDNIYDEKVKISIEASESIAKNIIVSENNFYMEPKEKKNITFTAFTDGLDEFKKYEGEITIITERDLI